MRKVLSIQLILATIGGGSAWADAMSPTLNRQIAATTPSTHTKVVETDNSITTTTIVDVPNTTGLNNEIVGITPQLGVINFRNLDNTVSNRGLLGLTVDVNG